jgi:hypothetical protein
MSSLMHEVALYLNPSNLSGQFHCFGHPQLEQSTLVVSQLHITRFLDLRFLSLCSSKRPLSLDHKHVFTD